MTGPDRAPLAESVQKTLLHWRARGADLRGRGVYAGYSNQYRCIFIHVPKTAGSSIARALFGEDSRHVPFFEYQRVNPQKFRTYFKFGFVRNPWDRLVSTYFFLKRGGINEMDRVWAAENLVHYASFNTFVHDWLCEENITRFPHFRPQSYFLADASGRVMVDFVGRYENLARDYAEVASRLGRAGELPVYNTSNHERFSGYYDSETRDIVGRLYGSDADIFGYEFEGDRPRSIAVPVVRRSVPHADKAIVVASHPRSGTHLMIDLLRRQFPSCEPGRRQLMLGGAPYWNLDELLSGAEAQSERLIAQMADIPRPVLKTHRRPDFFAQCQYTDHILPGRIGFSDAIMEKASKIYIYRPVAKVMTSLYAMVYPRGEVSFGDFIREVRPPWSRVAWWAVHLSEWMRAKSTLLVSYDELMRDPASVLERIEAFLGEVPVMRLPLLPRPPSSPKVERFKKLLPVRRESTALMSIRGPRDSVQASADDLAFMREEAIRIDPSLPGIPGAEPA